MHRCIAVVAVLALAGCSHMTTQTRWLEVGHAALMATDGSQTLQGLNAPACFHENDPITRRVIGRHPSDEAVVAWTAASFALRMAVANWLDGKVSDSDARGWRWARWTWHALTYAQEIGTVRDNHQLGVSAFAPHATPSCARP
jgi:hypothetical protein